MNMASSLDIIRGKMVLIVDDEVDVLEVLKELLSECKLDIASSFEEAKALLETKFYDVAILDIMGVRGYELLEIANTMNVPALMLTAHALSEENLKKSFQNGAAYFAPKEKIGDIGLFVADVLEAKEKKKNVFLKWFDRLGGFFDKKFGGTDWREKEGKFWENKRKGFHWR